MPFRIFLNGFAVDTSSVSLWLPPSPQRGRLRFFAKTLRRETPQGDTVVSAQNDRDKLIFVILRNESDEESLKVPSEFLFAKPTSFREGG